MTTYPRRRSAPPVRPALHRRPGPVDRLRDEAQASPSPAPRSSGPATRSWSPGSCSTSARPSCCGPTPAGSTPTAPSGASRRGMKRRSAPPPRRRRRRSRSTSATPAASGHRTKVLTPEELEVARGGMPLSMVQDKVDQFVIHYDVAGTSANCFKVLHDSRGLSVQFMLDIDGTIYQTCDVKEACSHATKANDRSIGIEIANMGSYALRRAAGLQGVVRHRREGRRTSRCPSGCRSTSARPTSSAAPPGPSWSSARSAAVTQRQYDYTPQQYEALVKLTAGLCTVLPKIERDYPRDEQGKLIAETLSQAAVGEVPGRPRALPRPDEQERPGRRVPVGLRDRQRPPADGQAAEVDERRPSSANRTRQARRRGPTTPARRRSSRDDGSVLHRMRAEPAARRDPQPPEQGRHPLRRPRHRPRDRRASCTPATSTSPSCPPAT